MEDDLEPGEITSPTIFVLGQHDVRTQVKIPYTADGLPGIPRLAPSEWLKPSIRCFGSETGDLDYTSEDSADLDVHDRPRFVLNGPAETFCSTSCFGSSPPLRSSGSQWPYAESLKVDNLSAASDMFPDAAQLVTDEDEAPGTSICHVHDLPYWALAGIPRERNVTGFIPPPVGDDVHTTTSYRMFMDARIRNQLIRYSDKTNIGLPFMLRDISVLRFDPIFTTLFEPKYERRLTSKEGAIRTRVAQSVITEWSKLLYTLYCLTRTMSLPEIAGVLELESLDFVAMALPCHVDLGRWRSERGTQHAITTVVEVFQPMIGDLSLRVAMARASGLTSSEIRGRVEGSGFQAHWLDLLGATAFTNFARTSAGLYVRSGLYLDLRLPSHRLAPGWYLEAVLYAELPLRVDWPMLADVIRLQRSPTPLIPTVTNLYPSQDELERAILHYHQIIEVGRHTRLLVQPNLDPILTEECLSEYYRFTWRGADSSMPDDEYVLSHEDVSVFLWVEEHGDWLSRRAVASESKLHLLDAYNPRHIYIDWPRRTIDVYGGLIRGLGPKSLPPRPISYSEAVLQVDNHRWPRALTIGSISTAHTMLLPSQKSAEACPAESDLYKWDGICYISASPLASPEDSGHDQQDDVDHFDAAENGPTGSPDEDRDISAPDDLSFGRQKDQEDRPSYADFHLPLGQVPHWHAYIGTFTNHLHGSEMCRDEMHNTLTYFGFIPTEGMRSGSPSADHIPASTKPLLAILYGIHKSGHEAVDWSKMDVSDLKAYTDLLDREKPDLSIGDWSTFAKVDYTVKVFQHTVTFSRETKDAIFAANTARLEPADVRKVFVLQFDEGSYAIHLQKPALVFQCLRWLRTKSDKPHAVQLSLLIGELAARGMPYNTVIYDTRRTVPDLQSRWDYGFGIRRNDWIAGKPDFEAWEALVASFLRTPRGRAALSKGGFIWRIAMEYGPKDLVDLAKRGPSRERELFAHSKTIDAALSDDRLSLGEERLMTGTYAIHTGEKALKGVDKFKLVSWFPRTFKGGDYWSHNMETRFVRILERYCNRQNK